MKVILSDNNIIKIGDIYFKPSYGDIKEIFNALDNSGSGGGGYIGNIQKSEISGKKWKRTHRLTQ